MMAEKARGQDNAGIIKAYFVLSGEPKYREICVGLNNCVAVGACVDVPKALSVLGIDDPDLVELVMKAMCGVVE
jgi:hypothetical protein